MKQPKTNLKSQMLQLRSDTQSSELTINYQRVIEKQKQIILSLSQQILLLKSYISLDRTNGLDGFCSQISIINTSTSQNDHFYNKDLEQSVNNCKNYEKVIREIAKILALKDDIMPDDPIIVESIKKLKQNEDKKEPRFIERIKIVKQQFTVQKIVEKPVEKIVQRIVYVDRPMQKDKLLLAPGKYNQRKNSENQEERELNRTCSQKNIKKRNGQNYQQDYRQQGWNKSKFDYKKNEGGNLIKKRSEVGKHKFTYGNYYQKQY